MPCARGDAGFTLIEALLSIVLMAVMLAMIPGTLGLGRRAWESTAAVAERDADMAARAVIERRLAGMLAIYETSESGAFGVAFAGEPDSVMFITDETTGLYGGGRHRISIARTPDGRLVMRSTPMVPGASGPMPSSEQVLARGVTRLDLRYLDREPGKADAVWVDRWTVRTRLPALVALDAPGSGFTAVTPIVAEPRMR